MRKPLIRFLLAIFVCMLPLQGYAQRCAMDCDGMALDGSMNGGMPDMPKNSGDMPCGQMALCDLAASAHFSLPSSVLAGIVFDATFSPPRTVAALFPDRAIAPPDRPPINS